MRVRPIAIFWTLHCALCNETTQLPPLGGIEAAKFWDEHRHGANDTRSFADVLRDHADDIEDAMQERIQ